MPEARQICTGASRLVSVLKWPKDDKVDCPGCSLVVKGRQRVHGQDWYIETPPHRAVGVREARTVDWSNI